MLCYANKKYGFHFARTSRYINNIRSLNNNSSVLSIYRQNKLFSTTKIIANNILTTEKNQTMKKRRNKTSSNNSDLNRINSKLTQQLKALDEMTKQVKDHIKIKEEEKSRENAIKDSSLGITGEDIQNDQLNEKDIDDVFKALGISGNNDNHNDINDIKLLDNKENKEEGKKPINIDLNNQNELMTLFPSPKPYVKLPDSINSILTPQVLSNITQEENANWEPVIDSLLKSSICDPSIPSDITQSEFTGFDFHQLITIIPRKQKSLIVEKLHELAILSGIIFENIYVINDLLALCNLLPKEKADILVNTLIQDINLNFNENELNDDNDNKELIKANITTKAILLNHYARLTNIEKVKEYINELNKLPDNKNPMKNTPVIYTSIMQMYMRLDNYELAKETFDTMKFLSMSTSPSPRTYTSMILLDTLNNNIEHGISVYEEMIEKDIKIEPDTLLALAKGCGARKGMISKGWDFIIKYYENGFIVDSQVMEIMMYLAYVDGDLAFVRGIWMNICETNTKLNGKIELPHPKCTKWLFNTYYKIGDIIENKKNNKDNNHIPIGLIDNRVKSIRMKVLELVNFEFNDNAPPFLPIIEFDGFNLNLVLNETKAIWKYLILNVNNKKYFSESLIEAYLYVIGRYDKLENFIKEWDELTIFDKEGIKEMDITIEEPEDNNNIEEDNENKNIVKIDTNEKQLNSFINPILRTDRLYNMCMHIARNQGNLSFAQKIWIERGKYRKCNHFQRLSITKQDEADFKFARLMLSVLTHLGNVGDAYKLVLSSQNRFVWTKYHLKSLLMLCERLGYVTFGKELMKVIKRGDKWTRRQRRNK